ncbi:MAG: iron-sulfur cluster assembly accessory protein [Chlamydiota bacterium]
MDQAKKETTQEKELITLTEIAANKFLEILKQEGKEGYGLRLQEVREGCSGFKHKLDFSEKAKESDVITYSFGVEIHVDQEQLPRLIGCMIDYVEDLQNPGFKVHNPNAKSSCRCGSSHSY